MNTDTDYTICNLDAHPYVNGYTTADIPNTIYGYNNNINSRAIDTGQQNYYGSENMLPPGLSGVDLSLGNQGLTYPVSAPVVPRTTRHQGYELGDTQSHLVEHYIPPHAALAGDLGPGQTINSGRSNFGTTCIDNLTSCSLSNVYGATVNQQVPSPVKSEPSNGQNLQNKPFRWMQIKRNAPKPGKSLSFTNHRSVIRVSVCVKGFPQFYSMRVPIYMFSWVPRLVVLSTQIPLV